MNRRAVTTNRGASVLLAVLAVVAALVLAGCGDDDDSDPGLGGGFYDDPQNRFSFALPKDWVQDRSGTAEADVAFVDSKDDTSGGPAFRSNITLQIAEDINSTLDAAAVVYRENNLRDLPLYDANTDERVELRNGGDGQLLGGIYKADNIRLQVLQLLVSKDGTGYVLQLTTPVASYPDREAELRAAVLSFQVH